jgi:hypothetical protein
MQKIKPRKAKFALDFFADHGVEEIEGITFGDYWNGWDCPYFTFENAKKLLDIFDEGHLKYDPKNDAFEYDPYQNGEEVDIFESTMIEGKKYYSVGGWNFCWYEVSNEESEA